MESYWQVVEPLLPKIEFHDGPEAFARSVSALPRSSLLLFAAHMCLAEIHDGGLLQLFWNNTGVMVPEGIEGLIAMEMPETAAALRVAARTLGTPYPRDRDQRWDAMLAASGLSEAELTQIFRNHREDLDETKGLYLTFAEVTASLPFADLDQQLRETAETENGGFQQAATRFADAPRLPE